jgi:integration host factor subunit alpha
MDISFDSIDSLTITKLELTALLFEQIGLNKREARDFIDYFFERIIFELLQGRPVKISGFGNFELRIKPSRPGRNPRTGSQFVIPIKKVIVFKPSTLLKQRFIKA